MPDWLTGILAFPGFGWLIAAIIVAGLVRGFSGFGSAMVIMPIASIVLDPVSAITFLVMVDFLGPLPNLPKALKDGEKGDMIRLAIGALIALPVGVAVLSQMPVEAFRWLVSILVFCLLMALIAGWRYRGRLTPRMVTGAGMLGGLFAGSAGLPGPPVIMLYMPRTHPSAVIRANLNVYLVLIDVMMIAVIASFGLLLATPLIAGLVLVVPYMVANRIGAALFRPGKERLFRGVAYTIIATSAIIGLPVWQ